MSEFRIENGWLVRDVNEHTCGGSSTEWPYAHEPGCGTIPELRLDNLPGWPGTVSEQPQSIGEFIHPESVAAHQGIADPAVAAICTIERAVVQAMVRLQEAARRTETTRGWELQA